MLLTREDALALFEQRRQAWLREDVEAYLALWSEDMTFQSPVHAEPLRGRAAFAELVRQSFAFSRPVRFDFEHIAVHGAVVLAEWTIAVERRDGARVLEWRGMSVAEIRDGVIRMWREYWNPAFLLP
ncbi:MAG TPA: nuclear transport factor 2 family protein [Candidatus Acidoferrales bacterium]|nr:nuclear transport factor 2 family protein [Candidatus Acidoferrales bacterium]